MERSQDSRLLVASQKGDAGKVKRAIEEGANIEAKNVQVREPGVWCVSVGLGG